MNTNAIKNFYEDVRYLTCMHWEQFQQHSQFSPEDSYMDCKDKLTSVLCHLPKDDTRAWCYFQTVYEDIPVQHRLPLFFECVYRSFSVDYPSVLVMIADYLNRLETPEMKNERINKAKIWFSRNMTQDGKLLVYRCVKEGDLLPRSALEFTASITDAEHDYNNSDVDFVVVCEHEVAVEDILYCNYTFGDTVFIVPEDIKSGVYGYSGDLGTLNIHTLETQFPYEFECFKDSHEDLDEYYWIIDPTSSYIVPDRSLYETPIEALEAKVKGDFDLYHKLRYEHYKLREKEHQQKMDDEYSRYLKARQGK